MYAKTTRMNKTPWGVRQRKSVDATGMKKNAKTVKRNNSADNLFNRILKKGQIGHLAEDNQRSRVSESKINVSRYMEVHDNKITKLLGFDEK